MDNGENEIDRSPTIAVFLTGESFLQAANSVQKASEDGTLKLRFNMPIYYLYSHALELTLKAFLQSKGVTPKELASRRWGHNLSMLWSGCVERGLELAGADHGAAAELVSMLSESATDFEFRYIKLGYYRLPHPTAISDVVSKLRTAIYPYVEATLSNL